MFPTELKLSQSYQNSQANIYAAFHISISVCQIIAEEALKQMYSDLPFFLYDRVFVLISLSDVPRSSFKVIYSLKLPGYR